MCIRDRAPQKLVGWNFRPAGANKRYIPDEYFALPSLGVWMGAGSTPSAEEIAAQDPDVLLCYWTVDEAGCSMADEIRNQTGIPVVLVDYDLRNASKMFRFVGKLIDCSERGEELVSYTHLPDCPGQGSRRSRRSSSWTSRARTLTWAIR